ncbi:hypothetical protein SUDANB105_00080 [Streptomyces sp. enrichment culture]
MPDTDQVAHDRAALLGHAAQQPLEAGVVTGTHHIRHTAADVLSDGESVHVGERLVQVHVPKILVQHEQADRAGLEDGVEEGEVGLDPASASS